MAEPKLIPPSAIQGEKKSESKPKTAPKKDTNMAKSPAKKKPSKQMIVVPKPHPPVLVQGMGKIGQLPGEKKGPDISKIKAVLDQQHTLYAVGAAAALGWLQKEGMLANIPNVQGIDKVALLGAAAWGAAKWSKNRTVDHVATGLLSVAAYRMLVKDETGGIPAVGLINEEDEAF
jgi:hypothetical protein